jgi:hypothetical protein
MDIDSKLFEVVGTLSIGAWIALIVFAVAWVTVPSFAKAMTEKFRRDSKKIELEQARVVAEANQKVAEAHQESEDLEVQSLLSQALLKIATVNERSLAVNEKLVERLEAIAAQLDTSKEVMQGVSERRDHSFDTLETSIDAIPDKVAERQQVQQQIILDLLQPMNARFERIEARLKNMPEQRDVMAIRIGLAQLVNELQNRNTVLTTAPEESKVPEPASEPESEKSESEPVQPKVENPQAPTPA